jgi:hypothetical protein
VNLSHQRRWPFDHVSIVQMENNASTSTMNMRRQRDSKVRPVVNPHNIAAAHTVQKRAKYSLKYHPMERPWKPKKTATKIVIALQILKYKDGF